MNPNIKCSTIEFCICDRCSISYYITRNSYLSQHFIATSFCSSCDYLSISKESDGIIKMIFSRSDPLSHRDVRYHTNHRVPVSSHPVRHFTALSFCSSYGYLNKKISRNIVLLALFSDLNCRSTLLLSLY